MHKYQRKPDALYMRSQAELARSLASSAMRHGWIVPRPCEVCGLTPAAGHHHDYTQPYNLHWLCHKHHQIADMLMARNVTYSRRLILDISITYDKYYKKWQEVTTLRQSLPF